MPILFRKTILTFLAFLILFFSVAPGLSYVNAAEPTGTWYSSSWFDWYTKVYDQDTSPASEIFGERYTAAQVEWVLYSIPSVILNHVLSIAPGSTACIYAFSTSSLDDVAKCGVALIAFIAKTTPFLPGLTQNADSQGSLASEVFNVNNRQVSGIKYVKNLTSRLSPVTTIHAQGFGYTVLDPIQKYWSGFRNMAYAIIVLITIIFAFLIMFRVKLNPQTVISVQSALPKIITAVVLATFSYAIAGLLIDLMYVVGGIFASLMQMAGFETSVTQAYASIMLSGSPGPGTSFYIFWYMLIYAVYFIIALLCAFLAIFFGNLVVFGIFGIVVSFLFLVLWVWIIVLMFVYTVKIPWILIKNLISIYLSIVVAPLQIVAGTLIPSIGFEMWLKKLISELLVFPVTGLFMYLAMKALGSSFVASGSVLHLDFFFPNAIPGKLWAPDIIGSTASMSPLLWLAISFTFIALLPKVVDLMKAMIMGEKFSFGNAMGEAVGSLNSAWGLTGGPIWNAAARNREESYVSWALDKGNKYFTDRERSGLAETLGVVQPPNMVREIHNLTEQLKNNKNGS